MSSKSDIDIIIIIHYVILQMSSMSEDSGLGVSDNGQVCTDRQHHSGGDTHRRPPINTKDKVY